MPKRSAMSKNDLKMTGSLDPSEPAFILVGKLRRAHGVKGEIPIEIYTESVELLSPGCIVYIGRTLDLYTIEETRWKQQLLLVKFKEIDDRTVVSQLTNKSVYLMESQLPPLGDDEYYDHELIGVDVFFESGEYAGVLTEVLQTGANDVYLLVGPDGKEILIPAIDDMILEIDLVENKMVIMKLEWYGGGDNER